MKIGMYFNSTHLDEWTWDEILNGEVGLSGTDSQFLHLTYWLAEQQHAVFFFSTQQPTPTVNIKHIQVNDLENALDKSKAFDIDILIFNNRENDETANGICSCEKWQQPCIVWCQNGPSPKIADLLAEHNFVRRVICVSATQADAFRDHPIFDKTEFIYNAIDLNLFSKALPATRDPYKVIYIGSLTQSKGFQHLAAAWPKVHKIFPNANLTAIGSAKLYNRHLQLGPLGVAQPEFEQKYIIPYLGATTQANKNLGVTFLGLVSPKDVRSIIATASVGVVNPNCSGSIETFCLSAVEIQAGGIVVVGGNRGGLRETVKNGQTGILINSEKELATTLISLLNNKKQSKLIGSQGKHWVKEHFHYSHIVDQWQVLLEAVARGEQTKVLKFVWHRTDLKVAMREVIRQARRVPIVGNKIPTLRQLRLKVTK